MYGASSSLLQSCAGMSGPDLAHAAASFAYYSDLNTVYFRLDILDLVHGHESTSTAQQTHSDNVPLVPVLSMNGGLFENDMR